MMGRLRKLTSDEEEVRNEGGLPPNVRLAEEGGRTVVYTTHKTSDAGTIVARQDFDPVVAHHYRPAGIGNDIPIYTGKFSLAPDLNVEHEGDIHFTWNPTPRLIARGGANRSIIDDIFGAAGDPTEAPKWTRMGDVHVDTSLGIPPQPSGEPSIWDKGITNSWMEDRIASPDVGEGDDLDSLTFLIPNGWQSIGGTRVRDREKPWVWWDGGIRVQAAGWALTLDPIASLSRKYWQQLAASGTSDVTHVGRLTRVDASRFSAADAEKPCNAIRLAISLALGRSVQCLLPVGWQESKAVWAKWHCGGVDRMRNVHALLDETEAVDQLEQIVARCLDFTADEYREEVLQYAISYYLTASYDVNVELAVALPVSALQLLAFSRFVEIRGVESKGSWEALSTGQQIRRLLNDCSVPLGIPAHFTHFQGVASILGPMSDGSPRDALQCLIKMRNDIIHPTRDKATRWTAYQWAEASEIALDYLRFAILNTIGYSGRIRSAAQESKYLGSLTEVPWAP
ncbi:hypothetical protein [Pseudonocardia sp. T1-2H]|uniref:hypothetical protein n=1 Tax=Pseudonocardia sp. T1-2H TaxID=3128899 RepID=UPI0031019A26